MWLPQDGEGLVVTRGTAAPASLGPLAAAPPVSRSWDLSPGPAPRKPSSPCARTLFSLSKASKSNKYYALNRNSVVVF